MGPISTGDPFVNGGTGSTGALSYGGYDPAYLVGSIHSHSAGNHLPSTAPPQDGGGDRGHLYGMQQVVQAAGGNAANVRIYIVAQNLVGAGQTAYNQINVFTPDSIEGDLAAGVATAEVDPNGQSCPE